MAVKAIPGPTAVSGPTKRIDCTFISQDVERIATKNTSAILTVPWTWKQDFMQDNIFASHTHIVINNLK